jgi:hypothetical protein
MLSTGGFVWQSRISSWCRHALNRTVRPKNAELRTREYLTEAEVERLIKAARANRWGQRDATMILMAFGTVCGPPSWSICVGIRSS